MDVKLNEIQVDNEIRTVLQTLEKENTPTQARGILEVR